MRSLMKLLSSTMVLQMKQSFARPMFRFCLLLNPIANTIFLYELFYNRGTSDFLSYVVLGAGLMGIWSCICFSSVGDINRERYSGTLPFIYAAPGGFGMIILGKVLGNTILSLATFGISYVTAGLLAGKLMMIARPGMFLVAVVFMLLCFIVVSICFAYIMMLSRKTELYMNLLEIPMIFLCGFTFPVEVLPSWVRMISNCLPPTWAVRMIRMSVTGKNIGEFLTSLGYLSIELLVLVIISAILYWYMDRSIRIKSTLEVC